MTKKQKKMLARILIAGALLIAAAVANRVGENTWLFDPIPFLTKANVVPPGTAEHPEPAYTLNLWFLYLIPYFIIGWDVLWKAVRNIAHGQVFDENFLMSLATVGALALGKYAEAVGVMLFYQVGELFQNYAVASPASPSPSSWTSGPTWPTWSGTGKLRKLTRRRWPLARPS